MAGFSSTTACRSSQGNPSVVRMPPYTRSNIYKPARMSGASGRAVRADQERDRALEPRRPDAHKDEVVVVAVPGNRRPEERLVDAAAIPDVVAHAGAAPVARIELVGDRRPGPGGLEALREPQPVGPRAVGPQPDGALE